MISRIARRIAVAATVAAAALVLLAPVGSARATRRVALADSKVLTFVLAGQSNMAGHGYLDGKTPVNRNVTVMTRHGWVTAREPLPQGRPVPPPACPGDRDARPNAIVVLSCSEAWRSDANPNWVLHVLRVDGREPGVGPGIPFADDLVAAGDAAKVRLVSCAINGTSAATWTPGGSSFAACATQIREAGPIAGVLYYQGEQDTIDHADAVAWPARFRRFVAGMRALSPGVPVVFAQLGPGARVAWGRFWATVKAGQAGVRLPGVAMIRTDDLPVNWEEPVHHTAAAERVIGRRFMDAWLRLAGVRGRA